MGKPRLLDLFSGAGGAARGYQLAGFHVTGVDVAAQPRYAGDAFVQGDALAYCRAHGRDFDAIHASPPCQAYSAMRCLPWLRDRDYPALIDPTREALETTGAPWVIENVERAPLKNGITLCGQMFGLRVYRHRRFESSVLLLAPPHRKHAVVIGCGRMLNDRAKPNAEGWVSFPEKGRFQRGRKEHFLAGGVISVTGDVGSYCGPEAMGIDWMTGNELSQAIPPAYTEHIGRQLLAALAFREVA